MNCIALHCIVLYHEWLRSTFLPFLPPPGERTYHRLHIPHWLPPECIVLFGFFCAACAGIAFAYSNKMWWAGGVAAICVYGNFVSDYMVRSSEWVVTLLGGSSRIELNQFL